DLRLGHGERRLELEHVPLVRGGAAGDAAVEEADREPLAEHAPPEAADEAGDEAREHAAPVGLARAELDGDEQPAPADLGDERVLGDRAAEAVEELLAPLARGGDDALGLEDVERRGGDGARERADG